MNKQILIDDPRLYINVFGIKEENICIYERYLNVKLNIVSNYLYIIGDAICLCEATEYFSYIFYMVKKYSYIMNKYSILYSFNLYKNGDIKLMEEINNNLLGINFSGEKIYSKNLNQLLYYNSIIENEIIFGIGPAGTGKTYLAVLAAINLLKKKIIKKIILTRPAIEAGEKLGFLPGDLSQKVDPYLRPLFDSISDIVGNNNLQNMIETGVLEIAPLAYMRGRTLSNSIVILDEAQNTTKEQMKMILTRLGKNSKMIINGDISQIDLPKNIISGLKNAIDVLEYIEEIKFIYFNSLDVVRNEIVIKIIEAYKRQNNEDLSGK